MINIRTATPDDAEAILTIYAPYIEDTAITFEYVVPSLKEFRERITQTLKKYPYLVATDENGTILGYAYASRFRTRKAYDWCAEVSIYIRQNVHGQGIGKALYAELEERLNNMGILNAIACITWKDTPNEYVTHDSPNFHLHLGYKRCALFHKCGFKFGQWFDMIYMEKMLGKHDTKPKEICDFNDL